MFVISNIQTLLVKPSGMKDRNENFAIAHTETSLLLFLRRQNSSLISANFKQSLISKDTHDFLFVNKRAGAPGEELAYTMDIKSGNLVQYS
jgi:hypothetical protein